MAFLGFVALPSAFAIASDPAIIVCQNPSKGNDQPNVRRFLQVEWFPARLVFSPDGRTLAIHAGLADGSHRVFIWKHTESESPQSTGILDDRLGCNWLWWLGHNRLAVAAYAPNQLTLESWDVDRLKRNWTSPEESLIRWCFPIRSGDEIVTVGYSRDYGDERDVVIRDAKTGEFKRRLARCECPLHASLAENGRRLCVGSGMAARKKIQVWDIADKTEPRIVDARIPRKVKGVENSVFFTTIPFRVHLSGDGETVAVSNRAAVALVDVDDLIEWRRAKQVTFGEESWIVGFVPKGNTVLGVTRSALFQVAFDCGEPTTKLLYSVEPHELIYCDISRDGSYIALTTKRSVIILDGKCMRSRS